MIKPLKYLTFFLTIIIVQNTYAQIENDEVPQDTLPALNLQNNFQPRFFEALSQRGIENYDKAIGILRSIENDVKDEPVVYFQLGLNYTDLEQYEKALTSLEKARALKPGDYDIAEAIFKVRREQKFYQSAIEAAFVLVKKNKAYLEIIAALYFELKNFEKALEYLEMSDLASGYSAPKDQMREEIYRSYGNYKEAIKYYKRREAQEPYNPLNLYRLAIYQSENQDYQEALISLELLKQKHPLFTRAYVLETAIFLKDNQPEKALDALKVVVSDRFLEEKFKVEAIEYFKIFVESNPEYQDQFIQLLDVASEKAEESATNLDLGMYYFETDKPKALSNFRKALEQNPQDYEILKRISILEYQLGKYDKALQTSENAMEIYPTQVVFMLVKANVMIAQAQYNTAESVLLEAQSYIFEENESMLMLYESLARTYEGLGELEKAMGFKKKADELKSKLN
jgi:tetratricopeptide (TPR) repeat protein